MTRGLVALVPERVIVWEKKKKREREREKERVMGCQQTLTAAQVWVHMPDEGHLSRVSRVSHVGIDSCT